MVLLNLAEITRNKGLMYYHLLLYLEELFNSTPEPPYFVLQSLSSSTLTGGALSSDQQKHSVQRLCVRPNAPIYDIMYETSIDICKNLKDIDRFSQNGIKFK